MKPTFFPDPAAFRAWLTANHLKEQAIIVGYYKVNSGKVNMTWSQSVDEALCFGWIDGVRHSIDDISYQIRFTPRKKGSNWSAVNLKKMENLKTLGLLQPEGIARFEERTEKNAVVYAFEQNELKLSDHFENQFKQNQKAWEYFEALAPSYKKLCIFWVESAKQEKTRIKRLGELISDSAAGINKWKDTKYNKKK